MKSLDIAFVTIADLPQGGGNTLRLRRLVETLTGQGHRVKIWNQHSLGVAPPELLSVRGTFGKASYEYVLGRISRGWGFGSIRDKRRAVAAIADRIRTARRQGQLDVVWFNNLSFYDTWPLTRLARRLGITTIQSYEDERMELTSQNSLALSRRLFGLNSWLADRRCPRMADAVVVISSYLEKKYSRLGVAPGRLHLIPTIIDCRAWTCPPEEENDPPVLLYSGAFSEQDEIENPLRALARLRDQGLGFRMVMLGDNLREPGLVEAARTLVADLALGDRVVLRGFVPMETVRREICSANILLGIRRDGPWSRSGLSTKLSEYLASGRLVIASTVGETSSYLGNGENALLVSQAASTDEIAAAIKKALSSIDYRRKLGRKGQEVARKSFDQPVIAEALQAMLRDIV